MPPEHAGGGAPGAPALLRPMAVADILDGTFSIYQSNFLPLFLLALAAQVPSIALGLLAVSVMPPTPSFLSLLRDPAALEQLSTHMEQEVSFAGIALVAAAGILAVLVSLFITPWFFGSTIHLASERVLGRRADWGQAARTGLRSLFGLLVTLILVGVARLVWWVVAAGITAGAIALTVSLLWGRSPASNGLAILLVTVLAVAGIAALLAGFGYFAVALPAAAVERRFHLKALGRSIGLVRGRLWRTIGIALVLYLVWGVVSAILSTPNLVLSLVVGGRGGAILGNFVGALAQALLMPFLPVAFTLLYYDLRVRREGLDLELMAGQLQADVPPETAPRTSDDASS